VSSRRRAAEPRSVGNAGVSGDPLGAATVSRWTRSSSTVDRADTGQTPRLSARIEANRRIPIRASQARIGLPARPVSLHTREVAGSKPAAPMACSALGLASSPAAYDSSFGRWVRGHEPWSKQIVCAQRVEARRAPSPDQNLSARLVRRRCLPGEARGSACPRRRATDRDPPPPLARQGQRARRARQRWSRYHIRLQASAPQIRCPAARCGGGASDRAAATSDPAGRALLPVVIEDYSDINDA
jgi:hypothetical protein